jgi:hypothetical protein
MGPAGGPRRGLYTRDFERWMQGVLEVERLYLKEHCEGNLEVGAPSLGTLEDMFSEALEMGICFHRGQAFGEHGEDDLLLEPWKEGKNFFI